MKVKSLALLVLAVGISSCVFAQTDNSQVTKKAESLVVPGFDEILANKQIDKLHLLESERPSVLHQMKMQYAREHQKATNFEKQVQKAMKNFVAPAPQTTSLCTNADFSNFDFSNWAGSLGSVPGGVPGVWGPPVTWTPGISSTTQNAPPLDPARHTINNFPAGNNDPALGPVIGYDPICINPVTHLADIPIVAPNGAGSSVRLGNANIGGETERLQYVMDVTPLNTTFYYQFAVVFENPTVSHTPPAQPFFNINVLDSAGNNIGGACGLYHVSADQASTDSTYIKIPAGTSTFSLVDIYYRKWSLASIDLSAYIGHPVTINFETADCSQGGHFGYGYLDAGCGVLSTTQNFCVSDTGATIVAPSGFASYQWYGPNNFLVPIPGQTADSLNLMSPPPTIGDSFLVHMVTSAGCGSNLVTVINHTTIAVQSVIVSGSCPGGASGTVTLVPSGSSTSSYTFLWTPGNFTTQTVNNLAAGNYNCHIEVAGMPLCGSLDTVIIVGTDPPTTPLATTAGYCDDPAIIPGPTGGSTYTWYNSSGSSIGSNDTLTISTTTAPGMLYLAYTTSQGCTDSIIYTTSQVNPGIVSYPAYNVCGTKVIRYDPALTGGSYSVVVGGPNSYSYSYSDAGTSQDTLAGLEEGTYTLVITAGGCTKDYTFNIVHTPKAYNRADTALCHGDVLDLSVLANGTHTWYDPSGVQFSSSTSSSISIPNPLEGTYTDTAIVAGGCVQIHTIPVHYSNLKTGTSYTPNICFAGTSGNATDSIVLAPPPNHPPVSFLWSGPQSFSSTNYHIDSLRAGVYVCKTSSGNCFTVDSLAITEPAKPNDTLQIETTFCDAFKEATLYGPKGFTNYTWLKNGIAIPESNADSLVISNLAAYSEFSVQYASEPLGCIRTTSDIKHTIPNAVFKPDTLNNVITPNGDAKNDVFSPFYSSVYEQRFIGDVASDFDIKIFNRWGKLVFETTDYHIPWDGKNKGNEIEEGVYFWQAVYKSLCAKDDEKIAVRGFVHVLK